MAFEFLDGLMKFERINKPSSESLLRYAFISKYLSALSLLFGVASYKYSLSLTIAFFSLSIWLLIGMENFYSQYRHRELLEKLEEIEQKVS